MWPHTTYVPNYDTYSLTHYLATESCEPRHKQLLDKHTNAKIGTFPDNTEFKLATKGPNDIGPSLSAWRTPL
jgi:hypothetical protein